MQREVDATRMPAGPPDQRMRIIVRILSKKSIELFVSQEDVISAVKHAIHEKENIPLDQQRLTFSGSQLVDDRRLNFYNIRPNDTIHLELVLRTQDTSHIAFINALADKGHDLEVENTVSDLEHKNWTRQGTNMVQQRSIFPDDYCRTLDSTNFLPNDSILRSILTSKEYGQKLVRICQNYRHADSEARELMVSIEHNWMKTDAQLNFLKKISNTLEPYFRDVQARVLSELEEKLKAAVLAMDHILVLEKEGSRRQHGELDVRGLSKALGTLPSRKKVKFAFMKKSLKRIRDDLEIWQRRFDPSWMLTMRVADSLIDQQPGQSEKGICNPARGSTLTLASVDDSIFKPPTILSLDEKPIKFSSAFLCRFRDCEQNVIIDTMACKHVVDMNRTIQDVRNLARTLSRVEPLSFGLLSCIGVIKPTPKSTGQPTSAIRQRQAHEPATFKFLFAVPPFLSSPKSFVLY